MSSNSPDYNRLQRHRPSTGKTLSCRIGPWLSRYAVPEVWINVHVYPTQAAYSDNLQLKRSRRGFWLWGTTWGPAMPNLGTNVRKEMQKLQTESPHIVVGTPDWMFDA
ncbi:unnamed protein product [Oncorhynchus mykiss]|uniref:Uncharacterized protein n=1 Tax=Oncorhynchus mykiss TaxID=8022 RepID=A0A060XZT2_ONCMY|nr:unnamed protein product [Oncorhynchus mykiss]